MGHLQDNRYQNSGSFSVRLTDGKLGLYARGYYPNGGDKFATAVNTPSSVSFRNRSLNVYFYCVGCCE